ncbi:MAG TPA: hypothetical protein DCL88_08290, partial [Gammaproteobacteria bacterium]|nr:hypothetical protein [Gammaproteobacteria bacterium]
MHALEKTLIKTELRQRSEEGCDVQEITRRVTEAFESDAPDRTFQALYDELMALPVDDSFPHIEPSTLPEIQAARPQHRGDPIISCEQDTIADQIHGGWLGRAAGCCLGK